jgi:hypothetical protein
MYNKRYLTLVPLARESKLMRGGIASGEVGAERRGKRVRKPFGLVCPFSLTLTVWRESNPGEGAWMG